MIPYSQQHQIISQVSLSFQKGQKTFPMVSHKILDRDKIFYRYNRYETTPAGDFKFAVLWTAFKTSSGKVGLFKILNEYDKSDMLQIKKQQRKIMTYKNTLKEDLSFMAHKILTPQTAFRMYKRNEISVLGLVSFLKDDFELSRLQRREYERAKLFISYFPVIDEYMRTDLTSL